MKTRCVCTTCTMILIRTLNIFLKSNKIDNKDETMMPTIWKINNEVLNYTQNEQTIA